jgi:hypothetical protein
MRKQPFPNNLLSALTWGVGQVDIHMAEFADEAVVYRVHMSARKDRRSDAFGNRHQNHVLRTLYATVPEF